MKWLLLIFVLAYLFCSACEATYNKTVDKVEKVAKNTYDNNKDTIKEGTRRTKNLINLIGRMWNCNHRFK